LSSKIPKQLFNTFPKWVTIDNEAFAQSQLTDPVVSIRLNPSKRIHQFDQNENVPWCVDGKYLNERPSFTGDPLLHAGCYYVQEASSMFLDFALRHLVDFDKQLVAVDLCAAPGGKSTLIASLLNDESLLISNEVIQNRASVLNENMCKWGKLNTWVSNSDPKQFGELHHMVDLLVIDAPCSGSGLFRKIPDYLNDWTIENVNLCSQRQKRILHDSYNCLAKNGILVYMTCSFSEAENEQVVDEILQEFEVESCRLPVDEEWGIVETESEIKKGYGYRFYPHLLKGEGFFLACFRKKDGFVREDFEPKVQDHKKYGSLLPFIDLNQKIILEQNGLLMAIHNAHNMILQKCLSKIKIIKKGVMLGKLIRNEVIPEHELAVYHQVIYPQRIELSTSQALAYLKKEDIVIESSVKGWHLVTYNKMPLGWIKNLGNRINNYYPNNYRILSKNILPY
jgi:16S rRNA C967 or C1407 C5-methylase (RsmB/RsmF family)/NOL1/NOP2/fmu family ribosome biogenesis protein